MRSKSHDPSKSFQARTPVQQMRNTIKSLHKLEQEEEEKLKYMRRIDNKRTMEGLSKIEAKKSVYNPNIIKLKIGGINKVKGVISNIYDTSQKTIKYSVPLNKKDSNKLQQPIFEGLQYENFDKEIIIKKHQQEQQQLKETINQLYDPLKELSVQMNPLNRRGATTQEAKKLQKQQSKIIQNNIFSNQDTPLISEEVYSSLLLKERQKDKFEQVNEKIKKKNKYCLFDYDEDEYVHLQEHENILEQENEGQNNNEQQQNNFFLQNQQQNIEQQDLQKKMKKINLKQLKPGQFSMQNIIQELAYQIAYLYLDYDKTESKKQKNLTHFMVQQQQQSKFADKEFKYFTPYFQKLQQYIKLKKQEIQQDRNRSAIMSFLDDVDFFNDQNSSFEEAEREQPAQEVKFIEKNHTTLNESKKKKPKKQELNILMEKLEIYKINWKLSKVLIIENSDEFADQLWNICREIEQFFQKIDQSAFYNSRSQNQEMSKQEINIMNASQALVTHEQRRKFEENMKIARLTKKSSLILDNDNDQSYNIDGNTSKQERKRSENFRKLSENYVNSKSQQNLHSLEDQINETKRLKLLQYNSDSLKEKKEEEMEYLEMVKQRFVQAFEDVCSEIKYKKKKNLQEFLYENELHTRGVDNEAYMSEYQKTLMYNMKLQKSNCGCQKSQTRMRRLFGKQRRKSGYWRQSAKQEGNNPLLSSNVSINSLRENNSNEELQNEGVGSPTEGQPKEIKQQPSIQAQVLMDGYKDRLIRKSQLLNRNGIDETQEHINRIYDVKTNHNNNLSFNTTFSNINNNSSSFYNNRQNQELSKSFISNNRSSIMLNKTTSISFQDMKSKFILSTPNSVHFQKKLSLLQNVYDDSHKNEIFTRSKSTIHFNNNIAKPKFIIRNSTDKILLDKNNNKNNDINENPNSESNKEENNEYNLKSRYSNISNLRPGKKLVSSSLNQNNIFHSQKSIADNTSIQDADIPQNTQSIVDISPIKHRENKNSILISKPNKKNHLYSQSYQSLTSILKDPIIHSKNNSNNNNNSINSSNQINSQSNRISEFNSIEEKNKNYQNKKSVQIYMLEHPSISTNSLSKLQNTQNQNIGTDNCDLSPSQRQESSIQDIKQCQQQLKEYQQKRKQEQIKQETNSESSNSDSDLDNETSFQISQKATYMGDHDEKEDKEIISIVNSNHTEIPFPTTTTTGAAKYCFKISPNKKKKNSPQQKNKSKEFQKHSIFSEDRIKKMSINTLKSSRKGSDYEESLALIQKSRFLYEEIGKQQQQFLKESKLQSSKITHGFEAIDQKFYQKWKDELAGTNEKLNQHLIQVVEDNEGTQYCQDFQSMGNTLEQMKFQLSLHSSFNKNKKKTNN